ncbi:hypothetical protein DFQ27_000745 [Actinomortierella ambigua]|uniref:C2 domain-containing protein n=1 Tax=Actinomortierella ambigua TaxID=1343610 RepID=A0A9P6QJ90_9FUNG|nr:hypothetical protein DFQ27_000745 [Actinomortierella ambigua]
MHGKILDVTIHSAIGLDDVDKSGKNDPYVVVYTDLKNIKGTGGRTRALSGTKKPVWNETLSLEDIDNNTRYLYVDIMDKETTVDEPIGFAAIPLDQVTHATNHRFDGTFQVYTYKGKAKGTIDITLIMRERGQPQQNVDSSHCNFRDGVTVIDEAHKSHIKSLDRMENLADVLQVAAAVGGLFAASKFLGGGDDKKKAAKEH